jgi:hypothetical protein
MIHSRRDGGPGPKTPALLQFGPGYPVQLRNPDALLQERRVGPGHGVSVHAAVVHSHAANLDVHPARSHRRRSRWNRNDPRNQGVGGRHQWAAGAARSGGPWRRSSSTRHDDGEREVQCGCCVGRHPSYAARGRRRWTRRVAVVGDPQEILRRDRAGVGTDCRPRADGRSCSRQCPGAANSRQGDRDGDVWSGAACRRAVLEPRRAYEVRGSPVRIRSADGQPRGCRCRRAGRRDYWPDVGRGPRTRAGARGVRDDELVVLGSGSGWTGMDGKCRARQDQSRECCGSGEKQPPQRDVTKHLDPPLRRCGLLRPCRTFSSTRLSPS